MRRAQLLRLPELRRSRRGRKHAQHAPNSSRCNVITSCIWARLCQWLFTVPNKNPWCRRCSRAAGSPCQRRPEIAAGGVASCPGQDDNVCRSERASVASEQDGAQAGIRLETAVHARQQEEEAVEQQQGNFLVPALGSAWALPHGLLWLLRWCLRASALRTRCLEPLVTFSVRGCGRVGVRLPGVRAMSARLQLHVPGSEISVGTATWAAVAAVVVLACLSAPHAVLGAPRDVQRARRWASGRAAA